MGGKISTSNNFPVRSESIEFLISCMKIAMPNATGEVFRWTPKIREEGLKESRDSPRKRMILPIHRDQSALVQRMVNFLQPGTFVRPHCHPREWASETMHVIEGALGFVIFTETGEIAEAMRLGSGEWVDIEAKVWHGVLALEPDTIILEVKRGPYDDEDKQFAEWAPDESDPGSDAYREILEEAVASLATASEPSVRKPG
ncbi:MAG: WbuC family cupin fold metalloprotein [Verrucomicrobiota bacterium]